MPNYPLGEEPFPNIQTKPPLTVPHAIPSGPVTGHQRGDINACPSTSSCEEAVGYYEVTCQKYITAFAQVQIMDVRHNMEMWQKSLLATFMVLCFPLCLRNFVRRENNRMYYYEDDSGKSKHGGNWEQRTTTSHNANPKKVKPQMSSVVMS